MNRKIERYGWKPDLPDHRDFMYAPPPVASLPKAVDLRGACPPVYDQGQLGSCTGNALAAMLQFTRMKQGLDTLFTAIPSRLFIYYNERKIEGTVAQDAGAEIRDGMKSLATLGACFESGPNAWPYDVSKFAVQPPMACYNVAQLDVAIEYKRIIHTQSMMQQCLAEGHPFVFGFSVYESFETTVVADTGIVPMPRPNEGLVGGHAVMAVGYDDLKRAFLVRNSWGASWGLRGYFWLPYSYVLDFKLASDFWTIRLVG